MNKSTVDAAAAGSAAISLWTTLGHAEMVIGIIAGLLSISWYVWRFFNGKDPS
jgi:hypothetical protein